MRVLLLLHGHDLVRRHLPMHVWGHLLSLLLLLLLVLEVLLSLGLHKHLLLVHGISHWPSCTDELTPRELLYRLLTLANHLGRRWHQPRATVHLGSHHGSVDRPGRATLGWSHHLATGPIWGVARRYKVWLLHRHSMGHPLLLRWPVWASHSLLLLHVARRHPAGVIPALLLLLRYGAAPHVPAVAVLLVVAVRRGRPGPLGCGWGAILTAAPAALPGQ